MAATYNKEENLLAIIYYFVVDNLMLSIGSCCTNIVEQTTACRTVHGCRPVGHQYRISMLFMRFSLYISILAVK